MVNAQRKPIRVFYAWQSDLPDHVNAILIRSTLSDVSTKLTEDHVLNVRVTIDEATRDIPGSPDIADSIFDKIRLADVFVCDLTKVAEISNPDRTLRKYVNPNVAIELGFAIHELGWKRIVLVVNEAYGKVPDDLPFDAGGHRASRYKCVAEYQGTKLSDQCVKDISNAKGLLRETLQKALTQIICDNPKRPRELEAKSPEEKRRERDVIQLKKVFGLINLPIMDQFIDRLAQGRIVIVGQVFFESLTDVMNSSSFHINDTDLLSKLEAFFKAWNNCFVYAHHMERSRNGLEAYFEMPGDFPKSPDQMVEFRQTSSQAGPLRIALDSLLNYIRKEYLEIDPATSGQEALRKYNETMAREDL